MAEIFAKVGILSYAPVVDGTVIAMHPYDPVANPVSAGVPLLIGTTHDEATAVLAKDPSWMSIDDGKAGLLAMMLTGPENAKEGMALYKRHMPGDPPRQVLARMMTDKMFTQTAAVLADRKSGQPAPVYKYRVDWRSPTLGGELRAPHGTDIPFVFDSLGPDDRLVGKGESQGRMTELMRRSFAAFARTGNPNVKGYPAWPKYDAARRATFVFDDPPSVVYNPDPELRAFWDKVDAATKK
jgi:para-nitrobenzyl esterase